MAEEASTKVEAVEANEDGWPIFEVWNKYETIAMHFNDLLIKLRTQALAAVAALSTIIGIFSKSGGETQSTWQVVAFTFFVLLIFWIAIWALDFCYYNPLLMGSVVALTQLEKYQVVHAGRSCGAHVPSGESRQLNASVWLRIAPTN